MDRERLKGNLDLLLLSVLSSGPAHGYAIISALRDRSGGTFDLPEGTIYPALHRLEDAGLLVSTWDRAQGRRRRIYGLTDQGAAALAAQQTEWRKFAGGIHAVLGWAAQVGPGEAGMSGVAPDLIAGYLEELYAGLRVPVAEAELIAAEAEDHLRETAAAAMAIGMTELEAQQAAISSFGPVRAVVQAYRRRIVTVGGAAMAAWKLAALLATTVGVGGLAGMGIYTYLLRSAPDGPGPVPTVAVVYTAIAAGGLVLLATRRLTGHRAPRRDPLSPGVTASCFLVASALLGIFGFVLRAAPALPREPTGPCSFVCDVGGPAHASGPGPGAGPVLTVLVVYAAMAAAGLVLLAARRLTGRRLTGHRTAGRDRLSPEATAISFLLASAPLVALIVRLIASGAAMPIAPALSETWTTPLSAGSVSAAPLVSGAVVTGCLAVAAGYGLQAALRRARRGPGSGALCRVLGQAGRGGADRAYV